LSARARRRTADAAGGRSRNSNGAAALAAILKSETAGAIFERFGFTMLE
jgi:hypothetical protein